MKKVIIFLVFVFSLALFSPVKAEKIDSFNSYIRIQPDGKIVVEEQILYDFDNEQKHGMFRDIPIKYQARGGNFKLRFKILSVTDQSGQPYHYSISYPGDKVSIKIGDADILVSGQKNYHIKYEIDRAINFFSDHDELYWNATGNDWPAAIGQTMAKIILPGSAKSDQIKAECFSGPTGSNANCSAANIEDVSGSAQSVSFFEKNLDAGNGLTVVFGFPKGLVAEPSQWQKIKDIIKDNIILLLPFVVFFALFYLWRKKGRDPEGRKIIIAQFESPDNLTPAEVGTLMDESADNLDVSSQIIHLAIRGYLKIKKIEGEGLFGKTDYIFEKLKDGSDLAGYEKDLFEEIFDSKQEKKLSDLKDKFYKDLAMIKDKLYSGLVAKKYFVSNPKKTRNYYYTAGIVIAIAGIFIGQALILGNFGMGSIILSGVLVLAFGYFMPARTLKGVYAKEHILGLKEYLNVAERDRINFHNAPEKKPARFEKLLPFAMVLGVEKAWAKQFEGIYDTPPSWYSDPSGANFSSLMFVNSLNSFSASAKSDLSSAPSSSASHGGSGFGGGGFSGGGFGGGGGGSW
jgi:uncharacterized membrane protein YgcG